MFRAPEPARQTGASAAKGGRRLSGRPCWNFAKGQCAFGDACAYLHDTVASDSSRGLRPGVERSDETTSTSGRDGAVDEPRVPLRYFTHKSRAQLGADPGRSLLARVLERDGVFEPTRDVSRCRLFWGCAYPTGQLLANLPPDAFVNHFPGTTVITHKHTLAMMLRRHPEGDAVAPRTFVLPAEANSFAAFDADDAAAFDDDDDANGIERGAGWIVKRAVGGEGRGTVVTRTAREALEQTRRADGGVDGRTDTWVAQRYVRDPLTLLGRKVDLRAYVLLTRWDPGSDDGARTRGYVHRDGLVRFAAAPWDPADVSSLAVHLTNNAAATARIHEGVGHASDMSDTSDTWDPDAHFKRNWSFETLASELDAELGAGSYERVWDGVRRCARAALGSLPRRGDWGAQGVPSGAEGAGDDGRGLRRFELLGLDLLVDSRLRVWLLEVNSAPTLAAGTKLGGRVSRTHHCVKAGLLADAMNLLGVGLEDAGGAEAELERAALGGFQLL